MIIWRSVLRGIVVVLAGIVALFGWVGWRIVSYEASVPEAGRDCAIILGAAVSNGRPSPVFQARVDHGIDLFRRGVVPKLIFTGGMGDGDHIAEGDAGADYAKMAGVPSSAILVERTSKTTLQNLREAKAIMDAEGLSTALIVSDSLHLRRSVTTAQWLGIAAAPSATPYTRYQTWKTRFPFLIREIYFSIHFRLLRQ